MSKPETAHIRFLKYIEIIPECGCWIWVGANTSKYGTFWNGERYESTHRYSYRTYIGEIGKGLNVLHRCDIPLCVNPAHLFTGTHSDNTNDSIKKGRFNRSTRAVGERNGKARLRKEDVINILKSSKTKAQLSRDFGVAYMTISAIVNHTTWKHIERN